MWIILKLSITLGALFYRLAGKQFDRFGSVKAKFDDRDYFIKYKKKLKRTSFGVELKSKSIFKITKEGSWDNFFKKLGLSHEVQTGDSDFDARFYVASDDPIFWEKIKVDQKVRRHINELFRKGCDNIVCNGSTIWVQFPGVRQIDKPLFNDLSGIQQELLTLPTYNRFDPFARKALLVESLIYAMSIYAWSGFAEWSYFGEDVHLSPFLVLRVGLMLGTLFAIVLIAIIIALLKGSSRGHRIIIESAIVLCLSFPVGGIQIVSDINKELDANSPLEIKANITRLYKQEHRRRKIKYSTYHMDIDAIRGNGVLDIPNHIRISSDNYWMLQKSPSVNIVIGKGFLNYPWYKSFRASR